MIAVEFGSKHNGFMTHLSDRDLLIIHDDWKIVETEKYKFNLLGYDISTMNQKKVDYLCKSGSLFIKHIIDQGVVVSGDSDKINKMKKEWKPKRNYQSEVDSNINLLELLRFLPQNNFSLLFAVDLLIISVRNILIRRFADRGIYIFAWESLFKCAVKFGWLNDKDVRILLAARRIKNAYRNKIYLKLTISFINDLVFISQKLIGLHFSWGFCEVKKTILSLPDKFEDRSYKQLRAIEVICAFYNYRSNISYLSKLVSSPNYFSNANI